METLGIDHQRSICRNMAYWPTMMLFTGMNTNLTMKPMKPMMAKPMEQATAIFLNLAVTNFYLDRQKIYFVKIQLVCIQNQHHLDSKLKPDSGQIINVVNNNLKLSNHQMIVNVTWKCFLATLWRQAWCTSARGASKRR